MIKAVRFFIFSALGLGAFLTAAGLASPDLDLDQVLDRLNKSTGQLRSFQAQINIRNWTNLLEEFDHGEKGRITLLREDGKTYFRRQIDEPQTSILVVKKGEAIFYQPLIKQAVFYKSGKRKDGAANLFLAFTSGRQNLEKEYEPRLLGREQVGSANAYVLELTPRSQDVRNQFSRIVFYLDPKIWLPVRQDIVQPNRDYQRIDFSDHQVNPDIPMSAFEIDLPKDVQKKTL